DEGSKVHNLSHRTQIDLANLSLLCQLAYHAYCCLRCDFVWRSNNHCAVIFDIDGDAGRLDDTTNSFPTRLYHLTALVLMNLGRHEAWRICRGLLAWCPQN